MQVQAAEVLILGTTLEVAGMQNPDFLDRPLGRTEHIYWLLDKLYCLNFTVVAELEGVLDIDDLRAAAAVVQQEKPALRVSIDINSSGRPCFKPVSAKEYPLVPNQYGLQNWRRTIENQLTAPFKADEAPLARVLYFSGSADRSLLAMTFHHSIADGKSGASALLELIRRSVGMYKKPDYRSAHPSAQELDCDRDKSTFRARFREIAFWADKGRDVLKFPPQLPGYDMGLRDRRKIKTVSFSLDAETSGALLAACRSQDTTAHGAIGAALLIAIRQEFGSKSPRVLGLNSLADLRGVLNGNLTEQDLGLYISTLTTVHRLEREPDFWRLAREIPTRLKAILDSGDANLINGIYTEIPFFTPDEAGAKRVQDIVALAPPSSMLTNIGRIEEIDLGESLRVSSLSFVVSPPAQHPVCLTANSYGGRMFFTVLYDRCKLQEEQAHRIVANVERAMLAHLS